MTITNSTTTLIAAACTALVLSACGGGGGGSTTATAPAPTLLGTSTVSGTVTGFGSVIVDGVRIDDHAVVAGTEVEDGSVVPRELKVGQHVDIQHDGNLVATQIRVGAEVEGAVDKVDPVTNTLTVVGQTVLINTDAALGPVTVFESPYTTIADIKAGDMVEVHGLIKTDSAGKTLVQATRIEKKTVDAYERVTGIISDLSTSTSTFKLGNLVVSYVDAKLLPAGASLANGQEVRVSIPAGSATDGTAVKAKVIKIRDRKNEAQGKPVELGGPVSALDATTSTFSINGRKVDASSAVFLQPGKTFADLKTNTYVVVKGTYTSDQLLKATSIVIRGIDDDEGGKAEIHGSILNFVSNADFMVRGLHVDASAAKISLAECKGATQLAEAMQVEVMGSLTTTGTVKATRVKCEESKEGLSIMSRMGTAGKVDATAKSFALTSGTSTLTVQWSSTTLFVGVDPATLDGKQLVVEGTMSGTTLLATKISLATK